MKISHESLVSIHCGGRRAQRETVWIGTNVQIWIGVFTFFVPITYVRLKYHLIPACINLPTELSDPLTVALALQPTPFDKIISK